MSTELRAVCLVLAFTAFVVAAILNTVKLTPDNRVRMIAGGLALFVLPFLWDTLEAL